VISEVYKKIVSHSYDLKKAATYENPKTSFCTLKFVLTLL